MTHTLPAVLLCVALTSGNCRPTTGGGSPPPPPPPDVTDPDPGDNGALPAWSIQDVEVVRENDGARVTAIRTGEHADFDRLVFEFDGPVPGYAVSYVDSPAYACGSGEMVFIPGDGWLEVTLTPAWGHTEDGQPLIPFSTLHAGLPVILEVERLCDYEAMVTWIAGVGSPNWFRVFELSNPSRLVIDIQH